MKTLNKYEAWIALKKDGGVGGGQPPLFANKMMYITPASLDGLTQKKKGEGVLR